MANEQETSKQLLQSETDIAAGRICAQQELDEKAKKLLRDRDRNE